jgi:hypothetical protein
MCVNCAVLRSPRALPSRIRVTMVINTVCFRNPIICIICALGVRAYRNGDSRVQRMWRGTEGRGDMVRVTREEHGVYVFLCMSLTFSSVESCVRDFVQNELSCRTCRRKVGGAEFASVGVNKRNTAGRAVTTHCCPPVTTNYKY